MGSKDVQEMLDRIKNIRSKGENVKMKNKEKLRITLIETQDLLEKNFIYLKEKILEANFSKLLEELSHTIEDVESKLTSLSLIKFCRDRAEKYLAQVTDKLHNLNLVMISLLTKNDEGNNQIHFNLTQQISNMNNKLSLIESNFINLQKSTNEENDKIIQRKTPDGLYQEGIEFYLGLITRVDIKKAYERFVEASNGGNINSKIMLARMYEKGEYVEKSIHKAIDYYTKASACGNANASYRLAQFAENELYTEIKDASNYSETAVKLYEKSAMQDNSEAMARLGMIYEHGLVNKIKDIQKATEYYKKAIDLDENPEAINSLGNMYYKGGYLKQNMQLAYECFKTAARLGNIDAMNSTGICYEFGKGVEINLQKASDYYKKASDKFHPEGLTNQAILLIKSNTENEKKIYKQAIKLLKISIHLDRNNKDAYYYIGYLHENGYGIEHDAFMAYSYYKRAMKLSHTKSKTKVAMALFNGIDGKLEKDENRSIDLLIEASECNEPEALNYLGLIYENGTANVPKCLDKSIECYKKSNLLGNHNASINLAILINSNSFTMNSSSINEIDDSYMEKIGQMSKRGNPLAKSVLNIIDRRSRENSMRSQNQLYKF